MGTRQATKYKNLIDQIGAQKQSVTEWTAEGGYTLQKQKQKWIVKNEGFHVELYILLDALTAVAQHQETTSRNHFKKPLQETSDTND